MRPSLETDCHTHLAPNVDDGSRSDVETLLMARGLAGLGVKRVHLTPHQFRFGNDFTCAELMRIAKRVRTLLDRAALTMEVVAGAEYFAGDRFLRALEDHEELQTFLHADKRCVLVELPLGQPVAGVRSLGRAIRKRGMHPVLAHPERHARVVRSPDRLARWRNAGWLFQVNLLSLVGRYGTHARDLGHAIRKNGWADLYGSDLHGESDLPLLRRAHDLCHDAREVSK